MPSPLPLGTPTPSENGRPEIGGGIEPLRLAPAEKAWQNHVMKLSVTLTDDQRKALEEGQAVPAIDAETQIECVVIRSDVFERVKGVFPDIDPRETYPAVDEVMREDWSTPQMAEYDDYDAHRS